MKKIYISIIIMSVLANSIVAQNGVTAYTSNLQISSSSYMKRSSFVIDNNGNKWIGFNQSNTNSAQLVRYNDTTWWKINSSIIPSKKVNALAVAANNTLWAATNSGIFVFQDTNLITQYTRTSSNLVSDTVVSIACGGGNVYAGTRKGLSVLNGGVFTNYNRANNGMKSDTVISVTFENATAIWLGNNKGLEKFNGGGAFTFTNIQSGQNDSVICMYIDPLNNKWLGTTNHGVIKYDNSSFYTMPQLYGTPTGVSWPVRTYSISKGPNGGIFFSNHSNYFPKNEMGALELLSGNVKIYQGVAPSDGYPPYHYSLLQYDNQRNKLFYVTDGFPLNPFLFSFDPAAFISFSPTNNSSDYLDINNVKALINPNADMGNDLQASKYFLPKNQNSSPLGRVALWMGGYHNGALRMSAITYRQNGLDFWPGPLDTTNASADTITSLAYNKVWKVNRYDIANYLYHWNAGNVQNGTFIPSYSILSWPAHGSVNQPHNLAPYVDVNNNGIYDPINDGDYPLIKGDQMIWWVFNDKVGKHQETTAAPMGVQVNASAYAFVCPNIADSNTVLNNTTFYNFKITNYSPDRLDSFYIAPWIDADLGWYLDDYIGCDVMNNYGYMYNGDNYDEDGNAMTGYHTNLPVFSCNILSGPPAEPSDGIDNNNNGVIDEANEKCLMHSFTHYGNFSSGQFQDWPTSQGNGIQFANIMKGLWKNGTRTTYGANGTVPTNAPCRHMFPGISDPYGISLGGSASNPITPPGNYGSSGWTQYQAGVSKNDMRFLIGVGPFTMQAGGTYELDYALVFSQDSVNCDSNSICVLTRAQQDNIRVKNWFDHNSFPTCLSLAGVGIKENANQTWQVNVYPNPANNYVFIEFTESFEKVTVEVFDMLGNIVKAGTFNEARKYIAMPIDDITNGMYSIKIRSGNKLITKKFVKE